MFTLSCLDANLKVEDESYFTGKCIYHFFEANIFSLQAKMMKSLDDKCSTQACVEATICWSMQSRPE